jgi:DNA-binding transcriptional ArsR family regulator
MKIKTAIEALGALAQESRLVIFRLLVKEAPEGLSAGTIAERLDVPAPTLSFHLAYLTRAGLINPKREGRTIFYAANYRGMNALLTYLTEDCCQGRPEICGVVACGPGAPAEESTHRSKGLPPVARRRSMRAKP